MGHDFESCLPPPSFFTAVGIMSSCSPTCSAAYYFMLRTHTDQNQRRASNGSLFSFDAIQDHTLVLIFAEECAAPILHGEQITFMHMLTSLHSWFANSVVSQNHGNMRGNVSGTGSYLVFCFIIPALPLTFR